ncbi:putative E3 ubiquitin-protein ligase SMURF1 [Blattamonas nauphoetae]|uniref:HECT-type E3 ubiquitin transferase n=1 Tax=Blattamonas nauphoetae TaxID=2049346 RepID=A0ABQ9YJE9_9EUKA|nr:putative E3 ubiquitin-protein ligase SMURF1 [Blattamonas nauphoetae]
MLPSDPPPTTGNSSKHIPSTLLEWEKEQKQLKSDKQSIFDSIAQMNNDDQSIDVPLENELSKVKDENRNLKESSENQRECTNLQQILPTEISERDTLFQIHTSKKFILEACQLRNESKPRVIRFRENPDQSFLEKLADERADVSRAPAAAVVQYFRSGIIDKTYEALMDVDPETNLQRIIETRKGSKWSQYELLKLLAQILNGLDILHKANMIHRHLAPYFIYIPRDGPAQFSDLFDQTECEYGETVSDEFQADSIYRAPETLDGDLEYDGRIDIWSIGVMMYELASGQFPFPKKSAMVVYSAIGRQNIHPMPDTVPAPLRDIIGQMLTFMCLFCWRQKFLDALSVIQPVSKVGSCKIMFPSDANIEQSMVTMYQKTRMELVQPFYVMLEGTHAIDVNGIKRWFFTKLVEKLIDPNELGLFTPDETGKGTLTIPSDPKFKAPEYLQIYKFAGLILAKAMLERLNVPFRFNTFIWKQLQGFPMDPSDLQYLRPDLYASFEDIRGYSRDDLADYTQTWTYTSPDGQHLSVIPGGENERVVFEDLPDFVDLGSLATLNYFTPILTAMRSELHSLVPEHVLRLLSPEELELVVCGKTEIDVIDWKEHTKYTDQLLNHETVISAFWTMVERADNDLRREILRLGTGLTNAPPTGFKDLKASTTDTTGRFVLHSLGVTALKMPEGHMCFNRLDVPLLEDPDMMRTAFLMAIRNAAPPTDG